MPETNSVIERRFEVRRVDDRENYLRLEARFEAFDGRFTRFETKLDSYLEAQGDALMRLVRIEEQNLQASRRYEELLASHQSCLAQKDRLANQVHELEVKVERNQTTMHVSERIIWGAGSAIVAFVTALMTRVKGVE